jgi:hypothetical protein
MAEISNKAYSVEWLRKLAETIVSISPSRPWQYGESRTLARYKQGIEYIGTTEHEKNIHLTFKMPLEIMNVESYITNEYEVDAIYSKFSEKISCALKEKYPSIKFGFSFLGENTFSVLIARETCK